MSIDNDFKKLIKNLNALEKKQIPFASSLALNQTANDIKQGVEKQLEIDIDKPTPFTKKAFKVNRSSKRNLKASVEIKPIQAKYLRYQIEGGSRRATNESPVIIPRKKQRNKYGNLPRGKLKRLASQGKSYSSNKVVYQRLKRSSKPIAYFADRADYKKRFRFYEKGIKVAKAKIIGNFKSALARALRS